MSRLSTLVAGGWPRLLAIARERWRTFPALGVQEVRTRWRTRGVSSIGWLCYVEGRPLIGASHVRIGHRVIIRRRCELLAKPEEPIELGDWVSLNQGVIVRPGVTLGKRVSVGTNAMLLTDSHEIGTSFRRAGPNKSAPITVGDGAWIGAGVIVLPGVSIGAGAVIGAGSVVTRDCVSHGIYAGSPARLQRMLEDDAPTS